MKADRGTFDEIGKRFNTHRDLFRKFDNAIRALGEDSARPGSSPRGIFTLKFAKQSEGRISFAFAGIEFVIQHEFRCSMATRTSSLALYHTTGTAGPELIPLQGITIELRDAGEIHATGGGAFGSGKVENQEVCEKMFVALLSNIEKAKVG